MVSLDVRSCISSDYEENCASRCSLVFLTNLYAILYFLYLSVLYIDAWVV